MDQDSSLSPLPPKGVPWSLAAGASTMYFVAGPVCANQAQATGAEQKAEAAEWSSGSAASEAGKIIPMSRSNPDGKLSPSPACIQDGILLLDKPLCRARLRGGGGGGKHTASQGKLF
ncbi:unnamed protein product [Natator depressus]